MSIPTEGTPKEQNWDVRINSAHDVTDPLPAGGDAWTDYRDHNRRLTRRQEHPQAHRVAVAEPLLPGQRANVREIGPHTYEARRA